MHARGRRENVAFTRLRTHGIRGIVGIDLRVIDSAREENKRESM